MFQKKIVIDIISVASDIQAVNATVVGESTIDIQCWFIHGSDALGCKVVLVSDHSVENTTNCYVLCLYAGSNKSRV